MKDQVERRHVGYEALGVVEHAGHVRRARLQEHGHREVWIGWAQADPKRPARGSGTRHQRVIAAQIFHMECQRAAVGVKLDRLMKLQARLTS